jgi:hypothetical protein
MTIEKLDKRAYKDLDWDITNKINEIIDCFNLELYNINPSKPPDTEPTIDCNCGISSIGKIDGYCGKCGGYTKLHPKHKNNYKPEPRSLEDVISKALGLPPIEVAPEDIAIAVRSWVSEQIERDEIIKIISKGIYGVTKLPTLQTHQRRWVCDTADACLKEVRERLGIG